FSDTYDWENMLPSYDPWNPNPVAAEDAVAELMYELGVAVGANYEHSGTRAGTSTLGTRLSEYFFFEPCEWNSSTNSLIPPMEADLRAGFPCVVSIPNHAIVADGLMVDDGTTTYHFNYGWGGSNNGWWSADNVAGEALEDGATSLRPRLMAIPQTNAVVGELGGSTELRWILPKRRENEVGKLVIYRFDSGSWQPFAEDTDLLSRRYSAVETQWDDCDDFSVFELTTVNSTYAGNWAVSTTSGVGNCFYKPSPEYDGYLYHLTSRATIAPTESTRLMLCAKYSLSSDLFRVLLSTDRSIFTEIWSGSGTVGWGDISIDLAAYAGEEVYVRLEYAGSGGG
ncbi:MAG: C10 family peptidase, partial [Methylococcales bacterium]|nr:C10 family peptidase [Methylococcales bacterium]